MSTITREEALAQLAKIAESFPELAKKQRRNSIIKLNSKGGLYVKKDTFIAHSTEKNKDYVAGVNMDINVARALFLDNELLSEIQNFLKA